MDVNKKWHVVYTQAGCEKKVSEILTRRKIENYFPLNKLVNQDSNRKTTVLQPLFNSYVFIRMSANELLSLKKTAGVINLVYWLGNPVIVRDVEIEMIKKILDLCKNIKLEKLSRLPIVRHEGQMISIKNKTVKIPLPSMGYLMIAEAETTGKETSVQIIAAQDDLPHPIFPEHSINSFSSVG